ncbi:MAG: hypothetical protein M3R15_35110 [Acidobacteriota bacterium]|nr:hypothetical protein [Acidobacteriota bacterium]
MARQIIILETLRGTGQGDTSVRHVFWFAVPVARRVPKPLATSAFRDTTAAEIAALENGSVYEEVYDIQIPTGQTSAQIRVLLEGRYAIRQAELSALPNINAYYGTSWDGTVWS